MAVAVGLQSEKEKEDSIEEERSQRPRLDPTKIPERDFTNTPETESVSFFLLFHVLKSWLCSRNRFEEEGREEREACGEEVEKRRRFGRWICEIWRMDGEDRFKNPPEDMLDMVGVRCEGRSVWIFIGFWITEDNFGGARLQFSESRRGRNLAFRLCFRFATSCPEKARLGCWTDYLWPWDTGNRTYIIRQSPDLLGSGCQEIYEALCWVHL